MISMWMRGLVRRRGIRLAATSAGIAVAVALLACLGSFLAAAQGSMTSRAVSGVTVDWQVEVQPAATAASVLDLVRSTQGVRAAQPVGYARTSGLTATSADSTQNTGAGVVLGLPPGYNTKFAGMLRPLAGSGDGVLVAQQTAANLHVAPGSTVQIGRSGLDPVTVQVDGVVDLPHADSLFQKVGAATSRQPAAPPDNVVLLPQNQWHEVFDPLATARPDLVSIQVHTLLNHNLPAAPADAYTQVIGAAHNLEARGVGTLLVGDNLGTALGAARSDAAYAQVLFLFLGLPGAVLAGLLTLAVAATGATRRRREQALLRARGASARQLVRLAAVEAALVGAAGSVVGIGVASLVGLIAFGSARFGASAGAALGWTLAAALVGLFIAGATVLLPAWRELRTGTVASGRVMVGRSPGVRWSRYGVDLLVLAAALSVFWLAGTNNYQLVLAPDGAPTISVSYWAFAAPALLWIGAGLFTWRLAELLLGRGRRLVGLALRPIAHNLGNTIASSMSRQRPLLARSIVLLALALSFAASTAVFNTTYRAQAEVDAKLTNGADVTVTESPGVTVTPDTAAHLAGIPGVRAVEPVQHRFAYVGADLQDLFGVRPDSITKVTALQDSFFSGGSARQLMSQLAARPDSVLVSAETVKDFQLHSGDLISLRLQDGRTKQLVTVPFHYVGVVREFPTAPKDSFFVANADYIAQRTGSAAVGAFLLDTGGTQTRTVASAVQAMLGPSATVTDLVNTRAKIGSSLTAVDMTGLTGVELGFALVLAVAAGGLVLALGLAERRRSFAIAAALGATARQLRAFVFADALVLTVAGLLAGGLAGWALSEMLVTMLTGVFDPPPDVLSVPWAYLVGIVAATVAALGVAATVTVRLARRPAVSVLREL